MTIKQNQEALSMIYHVGSRLWVPHVEIINSLAADSSKRRTTSWKRGSVEAIEQKVGTEKSTPPLLTIKMEDGSETQILASECCLQNERDDTVDDLVRSDFLHEPGILRTLQVRYGMDAIYTYSGQILIATNPHKRLKHLYGPRMMNQYKGIPLGELSPHVYAIAEAAYGAMMLEEKRQSILISGESGAGKTESAKMVMQYLAHRAGGPGSSTSDDAKGSLVANKNAQNYKKLMTQTSAAAPIEEQVLESNPLLEAFGNAKTVRNDNSSRFGKFVEIDFDIAGRVTGAAISTYLLERSRVVSIRSPERSFHIFYQLCAGANDEQRRSLHLENGAPGFRYLSQSDSFFLQDIDDAEAFRYTLDAMTIVGIHQEIIDSILRIVAGILHLGNITFVDGTVEAAILTPGDNDNDNNDNEDGGGEAAQALRNASTLLGVPSDELLGALTTRAIETRGERIVKHLDAASADESRDALAKTLYSRLFDWLVAAINRKIGALGSNAHNNSNNNNNDNNNNAMTRSSRTIGILDIYGFECFDTNSFEQLCINLANEKLQQAFNAHVFKGEQAEYAEEGISWSFVDFIDNEDVLDLLEGSSGVFPLIDEACRLPRATHQDLAHALRTKLASRGRFGAPRRDQNAFVINHYAGEVVYSTDALLDKNRDFVVSEHAGLMRRSSVNLVRLLFGSNMIDDEDTGGGEEPISPVSKQKKTASNNNNNTINNASSNHHRRSAFMLSSVGSRFRRQLSGLMTTLNECQPHFIRCIKPNPSSDPGALTPPYVLEQLRAGGVLEAVRIACAGYPTRKHFLPFAQRYVILLGGNKHHRYQELDSQSLPTTPSGFIDWDVLSDRSVIEIVKKILSHGAGLIDADSNNKGWELGKTRVFLRAGVLAQLEGARGRCLSAAATKIQAAWRGRDARAHLAVAKKSAAKIQAVFRMYMARKTYEDARKEAAARRIQSIFRMQQTRAGYLNAQRNHKATVIQKHWRRHVARTHFLYTTEMGHRESERARIEAQVNHAAVLIQAQWRRIMAQRQYAVLRAHAAKVASLQDENARLALALQRAEEALIASHAHASTLGSQMDELRVQVESARADAVHAATAGAAGAEAAAHEAAASLALELEKAHQRTVESLRAETDVAKEQHQLAESRALSAESRLRDAERELEESRGTIERLESEICALKRLIERSEEENRAALEAASSAAASAVTEMETSKNIEIASAARELEMETDALKNQLKSAQQEGEDRANALKDAREKSSHLSSRVEALSIRTERLEAETRASTARESALLQELETLRRHLAATARSPSSSDMNMRYDQTGRAPGSAYTTPTLRRTFSPTSGGMAGREESPYGTTSSLLAGAPQGQQPVVSTSMASTTSMAPEHVASISSLIDGVIATRLPSVAAWVGASPSTSLYIPQAAWLLHRCLLHWAKEWRPSEVAHAAAQIERAIAASAAETGLAGSAYWLGASLATGALLKMRAVGMPHLDQLFRLGDAFLGFTDLHVELGHAVGEEVPVNVALLLSEEAKKSARRRTPMQRTHLQQAPGIGGIGHSNHSNNNNNESEGPGKMGTTTATAITTSPSERTSILDRELSHMGAAERHWRALVGGVSNVVETLKNAGVPAPAVRAAVWATLRYIDGELLNALLLRRDCCSVSAAKALQTGIAALRELSTFIGGEWCCSSDDASKAMERSSQAAKYLIQGKDDCVRKALKGVNILPDLARLCPSLTLQQVHRLTEHQHDDWLVGAAAAGSQTMVLLETLKRLMSEQRYRMDGASPAPLTTTTTITGATTGGPVRALLMTPAKDGINADSHATDQTSAATSDGFQTPSSSLTPENSAVSLAASPSPLLPPSTSKWIAFGTPSASIIKNETTNADNNDDDDEMDEEDLLVDSRASFELFRSQHPLTRRLLTDAARSFVQASTSSHALRSGPRLPDGSLPQRSPKGSASSSPSAGETTTPAAPTGLSLLDAIDRSCTATELPNVLKSDPSFAFLVPN